MKFRNLARYAGAFVALGATALLIDPALAQTAAPTPVPNKADTAFMYTAAILVLLMTVPGLALFYGGLVRTKNMLSMFMQVLATLCLVALLWVFYGYSLAFTNGGALNDFVGGFSKAFLKGVDSTTSSDAAIAAAKALARETGAVVAVTGETDYVTDGATVVAITGGHALMPLSTALGCALSATVAAFAAIRPPMEAAVAALAVYGAAGALGAENLAGPGLLPAALCDMLYGLDAESVAAFASVSVVETA